ncbi:hypothetical protein SH2C18_41710 [Clostridium sediminicola]|uniref:hypothetical protein n=1 Tax=Clostridium sediminicola TaxID=3114879 RepID=UPI0031F27A4B
MNKASAEKVERSKKMALIGIGIMAVGAFMSCLAESSVFSNIGVGLLLFSIALTAYGFTYWQP